MEENPDASDKEAFWHVMGEQALSLGLDFLGGAISDGAMGGGAIGINALSNNVAYNNAVKQHGQSIIDKGGVAPLRNLTHEVAGMDYAIEDRTKDQNKLAKLLKKVDKKATPKNVGKLSARFEGVITKQNRAAFESALENNGLSSKEAKLAVDYLSDTNKLSDAEKHTVETDERYQDAIAGALAEEVLNGNNNITKLDAARNGKTFEE